MRALFQHRGQRQREKTASQTEVKQFSAPRTETQRGPVASAPRTETQRRTCGGVYRLSDGAETVTVFVTLNRILADSQMVMSLLV